MQFISRGKYSTYPELYGDDPHLSRAQRVMAKPILDIFDAVREAMGHALHITSGRRTWAKQAELKAAGYKAAAVSPHIYGVAIDVAVPPLLQDEEFARMFSVAAAMLGHPAPRLGYLKYRDGNPSSLIVHVDVAPMLKGREYPHVWSMVGLVW